MINLSKRDSNDNLFDWRIRSAHVDYDDGIGFVDYYGDVDFDNVDDDFPTFCQICLIFDI